MKKAGESANRKGKSVRSSVFSFFAGIGVLDLGFEHENFEVVFVNELVDAFLDGYRHSRRKLKIAEPKHGYHAVSIDELGSGSKSVLQQAIESERARGRLTGFVGGPPCPDFSIGGKNRGASGDNGRLTASYVSAIVAHKPDWFLLENVKGLWRTKRHREFFDEQIVRLKSAGYEVHAELLNSIEFGVPQDRDRIFVFGVSKKLSRAIGGVAEFSFRKVAKYSHRSAFENYDWVGVTEFSENSKQPQPKNVPIELTVEHWFKKNKVTSHPNFKSGFKPRAGLKRFKVIAEGDDSRKSFKRLHRWRYSPTAAYGNNEVHLHPYEARRINAAEALAIQSLPREFELPESMPLSHMFKTIGNAVPYLMARAVASEIGSHLSRQDVVKKTA